MLYSNTVNYTIIPQHCWVLQSDWSEGDSFSNSSRSDRIRGRSSYRTTAIETWMNLLKKKKKKDIVKSIWWSWNVYFTFTEGVSSVRNSNGEISSVVRQRSWWFRGFSVSSPYGISQVFFLWSSRLLTLLRLFSKFAMQLAEFFVVCVFFVCLFFCGKPPGLSKS